MNKLPSALFIIHIFNRSNIILQTIQTGLLVATTNSNYQQPHRNIAKHWNPKFKRLRALKVIKVELPNYHEKASDMTPDERNAKYKERGIKPNRPWQERPFYLSTVSHNSIKSIGQSNKF